MHQNVTLTLGADAFSDEEVANVARELCAWINEQVPPCAAKLVQAGAPRPGHKGLDLGLLGSLTIFLVEHDILNDLIGCLATYIKERRREVSLELQAPDGTRMALRAENLGAREIHDLVRQLQASLSGGSDNNLVSEASLVERGSRTDVVAPVGAVRSGIGSPQGER